MQAVIDVVVPANDIPKGFAAARTEEQHANLSSSEPEGTAQQQLSQYCREGRIGGNTMK